MEIVFSIAAKGLIVYVHSSVTMGCLYLLYARN